VTPDTSGDKNMAPRSIDAIDGVPITGIRISIAAKHETLYGYVIPSYTSGSPLSINLGITLTGEATPAFC
jgi:hypothetical protein